MSLKSISYATITLISLVAAPLARAAQFAVTVGGPGVLNFDPEFVNANPGDVIQFTFKQKNHTTTQSSFASPCSPLEGGFDSSFVPVPDTQSNDFPVAQLIVKDTNPVWVYCKQANHCTQGMVFALNPGDKFAAWKAAAIAGISPEQSNAPSSVMPSATQAPTTPNVVTVTATVTVSGAAVTTTYGSYPGSAAPTAGMTSDHRVVVGGPGKLVFDPSNITAQPGDTVTFEFRQKNHTVTSSTFASPCIKGGNGFDSGFVPVADGATNFPTYTIQVNDTKPIWAYCAQGNHCSSGMVFSVNAVAPNTFDAFRSKAMQSSNTSTSSSASPSSTDAPNSTLRMIGTSTAGTVFFLLIVAANTALL